MKNVYRTSTKQHGGIKSGISQSPNSTILQAVLAGALACWKVKKSSNTHGCVKVIIFGTHLSTNLARRTVTSLIE